MQGYQDWSTLLTEYSSTCIQSPYTCQLLPISVNAVIPHSFNYLGLRLAMCANRLTSWGYGIEAQLAYLLDGYGQHYQDEAL
jgi:hypothetical protein